MSIAVTTKHFHGVVGVQVAFLIPAAIVGIGLLFTKRQLGGLAKT